MATPPPNLSHGAQKVFEGMPLRRTEEDELFRGFLRVRDHRIGKTSATWLTSLKRKLPASLAATTTRAAPVATPATSPTASAPSTTSTSPSQGALAPSSPPSASPATSSADVNHAVGDMPSSFSATCGAEDVPNPNHVQPLSDDMTAITSKRTHTSILAQVVFDDMQQRYNINSTSAYSVSVVLPSLAPKVSDAKKVLEGMIVLNSVLIEQLPVTVVDRAPMLYILNVEKLSISPKPPWPVICLEADSAKGNFNSQICFNCGLWISCGWVTGQLRPPWPPPKQPQLQCVDIQLWPTPWPSFDFLTSVHLEKALSGSWHSFQFVKLSLGDGRLLHFATESFLLVAQLLISLQVGLVIGTTEKFSQDENVIGVLASGLLAIDTDGSHSLTLKIQTGGHAFRFDVHSGLVSGLLNLEDTWHGHEFGSSSVQGYAIRGILSRGSTCYMSATVQCLLVLDKLQATTLGPDASSGHLDLTLMEFFLETSVADDVGGMLNPDKMHDIYELLDSLRKALHSEENEIETHTRQIGAPPVIHSNFRGELSYTRSYIYCGSNYASHGEICDLSQSLPSKEHSSRSAAVPQTSVNLKSQPNKAATQLIPANEKSTSVQIQLVAKSSDSDGCVQLQKPSVNSSIYLVHSSSGEWSAHGWYSVICKSQDAIVQWTQLPLLLQQNNGVGLMG